VQRAAIAGGQFAAAPWRPVIQASSTVIAG